MGVAPINPTFAECLETRIKRIIFLKFLIGLILWLIVFYQPEIGMFPFSKTVSKAIGTEPLFGNPAKT